MELVYLAPLIFFPISLIFSMLGMGGAQLYIPILFWLGMDFKTQAIPLAMMLSMINSWSATIIYARKKMIDYRIGVPFGVTTLFFTPLGAYLSWILPTAILVMIFALFTILAALMILGGRTVKEKDFGNLQKYLIGISAGAVLGTVAGLIGKGGGGFIVSVLCIIGLAPKTAAATSTFIVVFSSTSGFISHVLIASEPDWLLWILCAATVITGSQLGPRIMSQKLGSDKFKKVFGGVLLFVGIVLFIQALSVEE